MTTVNGSDVTRASHRQPKLREKSRMLLHMPSISIIRDKTVTGTQSQLAAYPLKSFNYEAPVEYIFKPSLSAECDCCLGESAVAHKAELKRIVKIPLLLLTPVLGPI